MPDSYADIQRVATSKVSAIVKYSFRIMNNAKVLPSCSEEVSKTSAYIKLFSGFLAMDELLVRHPLQVYVESASLLATELGNPKDCKHLITLKELDYIHHWNEQSLKLHGDLTNQYIANDLPILFKIVADDIKSDGYDIETSILPDSIFAYLKDNPPTESPDDSDSSDDEYILQIDQTFDEINTLIPNVSLWKAFRKISKENFNLYYDEVFANKQSRPSPQKYVIEYTIISICGSLKKEPMVDSSGKLSDIGKYMQDAAFRLGNYGVKTGYITQDSWQTLRSDLPKVTKKSSPPKSTVKKVYNRKGTYCFLVFLVLSVFIAVGIFKAVSAETMATVPESSTSKATSPVSVLPSYNGIKPISKPKTGLFHGAHATGEVAPFKVTAAQNTDYYLLLCQNQRVTFGYYIHAGETLSTEVPLGSYNLYYACAPSSALWYGESNLWGMSTDFYKSDELWDFIIDNGYYTGYTLTLSVSSAGNTRSYDSTRSAWDELFE